MSPDKVIKPSEVDEHVGLFDRFAENASRFASRAPFFAGCVVLVLVWFPTLFVMSVDSSQLIINTTTTIVTFLMVGCAPELFDPQRPSNPAQAQRHR
jgi:hypothetical protein